MPLSTPAEREIFHTRRVTCQGFKRADGLWDIEGHMTDVKPYDLPSQDCEGSIIRAYKPLHDMSIRITVDLDLVIHDAEATMDSTPFMHCEEVAPAYKQLIGLQIKGGFTKQAKALFAGIHGCTHLLELLGPIATTAIQTTHQVRRKSQNWEEGAPTPAILDTCHGWSSSGPMVKRNWPHFSDNTNHPENETTS